MTYYITYVSYGGINKKKRHGWSLYESQRDQNVVVVGVIINVVVTSNTIENINWVHHLD